MGVTASGGEWQARKGGDMLSGCRTERNAPLKYFAFSGFRRRRGRRPKEALIVRVMQRPEKEVNMLKLPLVFNPLQTLHSSAVLCEKYMLEEAGRPEQARGGRRARREGRQCVCLPAASSRPKWA